MVQVRLACEEDDFVLRITNNMMTTQFLSSYNSALEKQTALQQQLADGLAIHKPSDNPIKAAKSLNLKNSISANEQYQENLKTAQTWMSTTESTITDINAVMNKVKTLVVSADSNKSTSNLNTIGKQVDELINQLVSLGNAQVGSRYLFSGQNDSTQPFTRTTITDPNSDKTMDVVVYNGDEQKISMPIQAGAVNPNQDSVNLTGSDLFGTQTTSYGLKTLSIFSQLIDLKNELLKTSTVSQTNAAGGIGTVSGAYTGNGYASYDVRIDNVTSGVVDQASYSTDGGNTWNPVDSADIDTSSNQSSLITLPDGIKFNIGISADNVAKNVYSFRVPQTAFDITQSNSVGGTASITGVYNSTETTQYSVRITDATADGQVTGAEYSTDGGSNWASLSNYKISQSNTAIGAASMTGIYDGSDYVVKIDSVDSNGQITSASYSTDGGNSWNGATLTLNVNTDSTTSASIQLGTQTMKIAADKKNQVGDTFSSTYTTPPVLDNTTNAGVAALTLPNGVTLNIQAENANTLKKTGAGDSYSFQLPQGNGPDIDWLSGVATDYVDNAQKLQVKAQTKLGTRMSMYEMAANMMQNHVTTLKDDLSTTQSCDQAQVITDFNTAQTVYKSALAVGAKIQQLSLVDFLS